jgi:glycerate kinase
MIPLRVVVAPSGFKECLDADGVAAAIARGIRRAHPAADVVELPLLDGGEGFAKSLVKLTDGTLHRATVQGPLGSPVDAVWGFLGGSETDTAVIDMASAAGLSLVPRGSRNPLATSTYGVGQLILAALDGGARKIIVGCGDSGTNDAGAGMAEALGARLLDRNGRMIRRGAAGLLDLASIDVSGLDVRLAATRVEAACNTENMLLGPRGVARIYGPQKGASPAVVRHLEQGLERFATIVSDGVLPGVAALPGSGASGGLGAGLAAFAGAALCSRYDILSRFLHLDEALEDADLVFTAEGGLDARSAWGKVPAEVGRRARHLGIPVIALAGSLGDTADTMLGHGIGAYFCTVQAPCDLEHAIAHAEVQIERCAENVMRTVMISLHLAASGPARRAAARA